MSVRMRTIPKAFAEIKAADPNTDLSIKALRKLVKEGRIPSVKIENKVLVNLDLILETLACYNIGSDSCALFSERRNTYKWGRRTSSIEKMFRETGF